MTTRHVTDDRLDEVLAEIERARTEPSWVPDEPRSPRRLLRAPAGLEDARWQPSRAAVIVVGLCALIAVAVVGVRLLLSPSPSETPTASATSSLAVKGSATVAAPAESGAMSGTGVGTAVAAAPPAATTTGAASSPSTLSIHVVGAVRRPGVVAVPAGSRVAAAVTAAGGMTPQADSAAINLARPLVDGEQVHVPKPGESIAPVLPTAAPPSGGQVTPAAPAGGAQAGGVVDLNTADLAALDALPGVGPVLAQRIVDWRTEHGRFSSIDELGEVSGIGEKAMERLRDKVRV